MTVIAYLLRVGSPQYINDVAHPEAFFRPTDTREEFLGIDSAVLQHHLAQAVIAVATVLPRQRLAKIGQQRAASTIGTIAIGQHLLELLARQQVLMFIGFLSNNVLNLDAVAIVKEEDTLRWQAI